MVEVAIVGMYLFHHKTRHWYFVVGMPVILAAWVFVALFIIQRIGLWMN